MILSAVVPLLVSVAIMIVGNTLLGTLLAVRMDIDGVPVGRIGLTLACYSLGFVVGTLVCPKVVDGVGHIRAFAAFAAIAAAVALLHALFVEQVLWAVLRMVSGFCVACLLTITESWLKRQRRIVLLCRRHGIDAFAVYDLPHESPRGAAQRGTGGLSGHGADDASGQRAGSAPCTRRRRPTGLRLR